VVTTSLPGSGSAHTVALQPVFTQSFAVAGGVVGSAGFDFDPPHASKKNGK
jgi:hypothetical protein